MELGVPCAERMPKRAGHEHDYEGECQPAQRKKRKATKSGNEDRVLRQLLLNATERQVGHRSASSLVEHRRSIGVELLVWVGKIFQVSPATSVHALELYERSLDVLQADASEDSASNASGAATPRSLNDAAEDDTALSDKALSQCYTFSQKRRRGTSCLDEQDFAVVALTCFIMATKLREVAALRLGDVVDAANSVGTQTQHQHTSVANHQLCDSGAGCDTGTGGDVSTTLTTAYECNTRGRTVGISTADLRKSEIFLWSALGYNADAVTALDVLHALLWRCIPTWLREQLEATAEQNMHVLVFYGKQLRCCSSVDLAVATLLISAAELPTGEADDISSIYLPCAEQIAIDTIPTYLMTPEMQTCRNKLQDVLDYLRTLSV